MNKDDNSYAEETARWPLEGQLVFRRFRLERILGRGGMGVVWLARDERLEENVALKFLPETVRLDPTAVDELKRETRKSRQLTHPNIVRIHDFVEDPSGAAISMEYILGQTLAEKRLEKPQRAFEPEEIRDWMIQVCEALNYAHHDAKIVHRDLKPANIMVSASGRIKVTDFGIARSISDSVSHLSAFQPRAGSGSPAFMSPQQALGEPSTPLDDIYGLGSTIYDLLTGKPPFYSGDIFRQIETRTAPSMTKRRGEFELSMGSVPEEWELLVADCLAKAPAARPQSAIEVRDRLHGQAAARVGWRSALENGQHLVVSKRAIWIGAGAVALLSILLLALFASALYVFRPKSVPAPIRPPNPVSASLSGPMTAPDPSASQQRTPASAGDPLLAPSKLAGVQEAVPHNSPADGGYPADWIKLGKKYADGEGVPKNDAEAAKWYRLAADLGNAEAQAKLGEFYAEGKGGLKSDEEAVKWFRLSADQGNPLGQGNLGAIYANGGQGIPKNDVEAARLLRLAADQGNAEAITNLGVLCSSGRVEGAADADAVKLFRTAADQGDARAQFKLGDCFAKGRGLPRSQTEAIKWYRLAASQGYVKAQNALKNLGVQNDPDKSR